MTLKTFLVALLCLSFILSETTLFNHIESFISCNIWAYIHHLRTHRDELVHSVSLLIKKGIDRYTQYLNIVTFHFKWFVLDSLRKYHSALTINAIYDWFQNIKPLSRTLGKYFIYKRTFRILNLRLNNSLNSLVTLTFYSVLTFFQS